MSTAVLSTCDVKFWHFLVASVLSLPKQLIVVYIGVLIAGGKSETLTKALVFVVGFGFTAGISWYIWRRLQHHKQVLLQEQEERRANREREPLELADHNRPSLGSQEEILTTTEPDGELSESGPLDGKGQVTRS